VTTEEIVIAIIRILGSLPVLIWPFPGAIIAMLTDQSDLFFMNLLHLGGIRDYQAFDKWLDQVYMLTFLIVALRWHGPARTIAVVLYVFRVTGDIAFEITGERAILFAFPNLFEFWFVFVAGIKHFHLESAAAERPETRLAGLFPFRYSRRQLAVVLPVLLTAKLAQEYVLHVARLLDDFTTFDAIKAIWRFLTPPY
jgi:hypothetical protein